MTNYIIVGILVCCVALWLYSCFKDATSDRREKQAIKQALKDAGYV